MSRGSKPRWWRWSQSIIKTTARGWSWTLGNWQPSKHLTSCVCVCVSHFTVQFLMYDLILNLFSSFLISFLCLFTFFPQRNFALGECDDFLSIFLYFRRAVRVSSACKHTSMSSVFTVCTLCCEGVADTSSRDQHNAEHSFSLWRALGMATVDLHIPDKSLLSLSPASPHCRTNMRLKYVK